MSRFRRNVDCEHAREWAALAPDGELSELERRSLHLHLCFCGSCTSFAEEIAGLTSLLRSEELVSPLSITAVPRIAHRRVQRRRSFVAGVRPIAAAAAVALMALGVASRAPLPVDDRDSSLRAETHALLPDQVEMRSLRVRGALIVADRTALEQLPSVAANAPA